MKKWIYALVLVVAPSVAFAQSNPAPAPEHSIRLCMGEKPDLKECALQAQREVEGMTRALDFAWQAAASIPRAFIANATVPKLRAESAQAFLEHFYFGAFKNVEGGKNGWLERTTERMNLMDRIYWSALDLVRSRYKDPDALMRDFEGEGRQLILTKIRTSGQQKLVAEILSKSSYLFTKQIDVVLARDAQEWRLKNCAAAYPNDAHFCGDYVAKLKVRFQEYYGRELDEDAATFLGYLQRRHRDNGHMLVSAWQKIFMQIQADVSASL